MALTPDEVTIRSLRAQIDRLHGEIDNMTAQLNALKAFSGAGMNEAYNIAAFFKLTPHETKVFTALRSKAGRIVERDSLYEYLYWNADGGPLFKTIDVVLCKIRKKIRATGVSIEIRTHWRTGYELTGDLAALDRIAAGDRY